MSTPAAASPRHNEFLCAATGTTPLHDLGHMSPSIKNHLRGDRTDEHLDFWDLVEEVARIHNALDAVNQENRRTLEKRAGLLYNRR